MFNSDFPLVYSGRSYYLCVGRPSLQSDSSGPPVVRQHGEGMIEMVFDRSRWQCTFIETVLNAELPRNNHPTVAPAERTLFKGRSTLWFDGNTYFAHTPMRTEADYHVDPCKIPPLGYRAEIPQLILAAMEARTGGGDSMWRQVGDFVEVPSALLSSVTEVSPVRDGRQEWTTLILVPEEIMRHPSRPEERVHPGGSTAEWAVIRANAGLDGEVVTRLEFEMTRYCRHAPSVGVGDPPSIVRRIELAIDHSKARMYQPPAISGPTRVTDYRFRKLGDGSRPVRYASMDGVLLSEDSTEVAFQLLEARIDKAELQEECWVI